MIEPAFPALGDLPDPRAACTPDDLVLQLRMTKLVHGDPSVRVLTRRVNRHRATGRRTPTTVSTVGYLFRPGRRRIDRELLLDVLTAMGAAPALLDLWAKAWLRVMVEETCPRSSSRSGADQTASIG